jgi:tetratricopeptide (TPR) repeat protein
MQRPAFYITLLTILFSCNSQQENKKQQNSLLQSANTFYEKGEYASAIPYYDSLIKMDSTKPGYYFKRAYCKAMESDQTGAIADYLKSIELNYSKKQIAYLNIGNEHRFNAIFRCTTDIQKVAEYDTALYYYNEALKIVPADSLVLKERDEVLFEIESLKNSSR